MDEQTRIQDSTRRAQDATRRFEDRARETASQAARTAGQTADFVSETNSTLADANSHLVDEALHLSTNTVREGTRLLSHLQQIGVDSVHDAQAALLRWQRTWPLAFTDPAKWWQTAIEESISSAQRTVTLTQRTAEVVGDAYLRLQRTAEQSGKVLQETLRTATSRMQELSARAERQRAA